MVLHYYTRPAPFPIPSSASTAAQDGLVAAGILAVGEKDEDLPTLTPLGYAFITLLLNTEIPQVKTIYVDANGNHIGGKK